MTTAPRFIRWFASISIGDIPLVGGKNASLGEMFRELSSQGVKVPDGFAVTAEGYRNFIRSTGLDSRIQEILGGRNTADMDNLQKRHGGRFAVCELRGSAGDLSQSAGHRQHLAQS